MLSVTDDEFEKMIANALDRLPQERVAGLKNVVITFEDEPSNEQREKLQLRGSQTLYGLYEGIPITKRPAASSIFSGNPFMLPDKITIFKNPIVNNARTIDDVVEQVNRTVWHEIAHYYGLDHKRIHELE